jgi:hypothetical protein
LKPAEARGRSFEAAVLERTEALAEDVKARCILKRLERKEKSYQRGARSFVIFLEKM